MQTLDWMWIEESPDLRECRHVLPDGQTRYVGYVVRRPGDWAWQGYVGARFTPVGRGPEGVVRRVVEQWAGEHGVL